MSSAPVYVMPPLLTGLTAPGAAPTELADLLRRLIAVQEEQVSLLKAQAANDGGDRRRALLDRWSGEYPGLGAACKQAIPALERAFLGLVREMTEKLADDADALTDEFMLAEFLDRYGTKMAQMSNVMNQLVPLADAAPPPTEKG